jgi:hypothetical protein
MTQDARVWSAFRIEAGQVRCRWALVGMIARLESAAVSKQSSNKRQAGNAFPNAGRPLRDSARVGSS